MDLITKLRANSVPLETIAAMKASVLSGDCPFCARSGFKSIAGHCQQAHTVTSRELRDLLGFTWTESICDLALHDKLHELHLGNNPSALGMARGPRQVSARGREILRASAAGWSKDVPREVKAAAGRKGGAKNKGQRAWNRSDEHGRRAMFRRGCRCRECDAANKAYWVAVNTKRRAPSNS